MTLPDKLESLAKVANGRFQTAGEMMDADNALNSALRNALPEIIAALRLAEPVGDVAELVERKQFPILGSNGAKIDWQLVADHGKQAKANHYQTVERLAERGGLSWCELHAVLHNRPWQKMDKNTAINECRKAEAEYLNAATLTTLSRRNAELEAKLDMLQMREAAYRSAHDLHGDGSMKAGQAWDAMRRAGDAARAALTGGNDA